MTLKNHFNIKFLKGYGHSISVNNSKIILKDCHDPFSEGTTEEWFVKDTKWAQRVASLVAQNQPTVKN